MTSAANSRLLFVNYHYIRDSDSYSHPGIHPISPSEFSAQINWLNEKFSFATPLDVERFVLDAKDLPAQSIFPTFDDGLTDHWHAACDVLDPLGIKGAFFVCSRPAIEHRALTVHKIQWLRAHTDPDEFADEFFSLSPERKKPTGKEPWIDAAEQTYKYDTAETSWMKFALNFVIPADLVDDISSKMLVARGIDERQFCEQTYMSEKDLRSLSERGHIVGVHGHTHSPFSKLGDRLNEDVRANVAFLTKAVGVAPGWIAYPYGRKNAIPNDAIIEDMFGHFNLRLGLTLGGTWNDGSEKPSLLSRINTNEVSAVTAPILRQARGASP